MLITLFVILSQEKMIPKLSFNIHILDNECVIEILVSYLKFLMIVSNYIISRMKEKIEKYAVGQRLQL